MSDHLTAGLESLSYVFILHKVKVIPMASKALPDVISSLNCSPLHSLCSSPTGNSSNSSHPPMSWPLLECRSWNAAA